MKNNNSEEKEFKIRDGLFVVGNADFDKVANETIPWIFSYNGPKVDKNYTEHYSARLYRSNDKGDVMDGQYDKYIAAYNTNFVIYSTVAGQEFVEQFDFYKDALEFYNLIVNTIKNSNE